MKLNTIIVICITLLHCSCSNNEIRPPVDNYQVQQQNDSALRERRAEEIIKDALYDYSKDSTRQEWTRTHQYMWYRSKVYLAASCGYDKNGVRITTQTLGTRKQDNSFCVNRRLKKITWVSIDKGKETSTDYQITHVEEHPDFTSFAARDSDYESITFNVLDDGRTIYVLNADATLTFFLNE